MAFIKENSKGKKILKAILLYLAAQRSLVAMNKKKINKNMQKAFLFLSRNRNNKQ